MAVALKLFTCFHLNLSFSSIDEAQHQEVISRCYWPLLRLAESLDVSLGVELSGMTLERILEVDPVWVETFRKLIESGKCELIGSGYVQSIGPLTPPVVNRVNQRLGSDLYHQILGIRPSVVLVNEQAWSEGMVQHYLDAGYKAVLMEWDNVSEQHPDWPREWRYQPRVVGGQQGQLHLLWNQSIQFQRFQRYAHGEIVLEDFIQELTEHVADEERCFALYGNDVEVFDFRPGRFTVEAELEQASEWGKIVALFSCLLHDKRFNIVLPSDLIDKSSESLVESEVLNLQSPLFPVPVKKQRKYNIARWAITGRDDLWLNTKCHKLSQLIVDKDISEKDREGLTRKLCMLWASDLRTHITETRWQKTLDQISRLETMFSECLVDKQEHSSDRSNEALQVIYPSDLQHGVDLEVGSFRLKWDERRRYLSINTAKIRAILNLYRGGSFKELSFEMHGFTPIVGTIPHGFFEEIELGADFYSGGVVAELTAEHKRITDLHLPDAWEISVDEDGLCFVARFESGKGSFSKAIRISAFEEKVEYSVDLSKWERTQGVVRVGHFTLLPPLDEKLNLYTKNGSDYWESIQLSSAPQCGVKQSQSASTLVTSTSGFGATSGEIVIENGAHLLHCSWDPSECAPFPMLDLHKATPSNLVRLIFSLAEMDETWRDRGHLLPLTLTLSPVTMTEVEK